MFTRLKAFLSLLRYFFPKEEYPEDLYEARRDAFQDQIKKYNLEDQEGNEDSEDKDNQDGHQ